MSDKLKLGDRPYRPTISERGWDGVTIWQQAVLAALTGELASQSPDAGAWTRNSMHMLTGRLAYIADAAVAAMEAREGQP